MVIFDGHGNADLIQNQVGDEVSYLSILNYAQFHGQSDAKLVFLNTCLAFQNVAPALIAAGVNCVVGFTLETHPSHVGWSVFLNKICNEGKTAAAAYQETWDQCQDWREDGAAISGDTYLWGESL